MFQFSLRNMLIAVAAVAVGTAALLNANPWWASLLWSATVLMLVFAGLVSFIRREAQRAFWGGYLAAGSVYLLLLVYSVPQQFQSNTWMPYGPLNHDNLTTTKVIYWGYSLFPASKKTPYLPASSATAGMGGMGAFGSPPGAGGMAPVGFGGMGMMGPPNPSYVDQEAFTQVGQALWMLFLSWLGGTVAFLLYRSRERTSSPPAT